ncbi:MAG: DUF3261 domain-containing protein [Planctomycetota bacterium]
MNRSPWTRRLLVALPLALALAAGACQPLRPPALSDVDYPGALQHPATLAVEAVWQQQVTATWRGPDGDRERRFSAAVQRRGDTLTVLGLSPVGSVGFSVTQTPTGVDVVNNIPDQLVIPPRFILLDVQRALYPWFDQPIEEGERAAARDGEQICETWRGGRLRERTFRRLDSAPPGVIRLTYEWDAAAHAPARVVLDNGWFGYRLAITTTSETLLETEERS